jgi:hypothetical protein
VGFGVQVSEAGLVGVQVSGETGLSVQTSERGLVGDQVSGETGSGSHKYLALAVIAEVITIVSAPALTRSTAAVMSEEAGIVSRAEKTALPRKIAFD